MTRVQTMVTAASLAGFALLGCGESSSDVPTAAEYDDVAKSLGTFVAGNGESGEIRSIHDACDLAIGVVPFGLSLDASGSIGGNRFGLEYDYDVSCQDDTGADLALCDDTTDSAKVDVEWSGDLSIPPALMIAITRDGSWRLTDVSSGTASLSGDSHFEADASFVTDTETREYHFDYMGKYEALRIDLEPYRLVGGTIRYAISADRRETGTAADGGVVTSSFDIDAVLTFDAEGNATLVLDGQRTYDMNVATGSVTLRVEG